MQNGGQCNRQGGDVGQCVEVCRAGAVAHPQPFLSRRLKAGIVTLTLCTQGVCSLETEAAAVNGKPVIRRFMFIGTQCDLWGRPDGTGHEKISRGKFPRLIFSLIPSLFERHISIGCADADPNESG